MQALKVETENQIAHEAIKQTVAAATTYKQLFKALPQTMQAVVAHASTVENNWEYRSNRPKLREVLAINNSEGATRARNLPDGVNHMLRRRQALVETTLASAVMLPPHDGMQKDHVLDQTWLWGYQIDTDKV
jgi:hypothetical protein